MSLNRTILRGIALFALFFFVAGLLSAQNYGGGMGGGGMGGMSGGGMSGGGMGGRSGGGMSGGGMGGGGMGGGGGGGMSGVMILPDGVLLKAMTDAGNLDRVRSEAVYKEISTDLRRPSKLRKVSLNRLEKIIQDQAGVITDDMANLAGLVRIENVFYYPETQDIVIAGPAEGWITADDGTMVGYQSGRSTLKLADLVVALRAYSPQNPPASMIGCSIDPTNEGLVAMQSFLNTGRKPNVANAEEVNVYAAEIQNTLGLQTVQFWGVSPKTHFAATLAAADYRMKLIGIGLEAAPVKMTTYVEKSNPAAMARNALVRWFFQPDYQCVVKTADGTAIAIRGDGVKLVGEDELVGGDGSRVGNKTSNRATKLYAQSFTESFSEIAAKVPVYAALRNLIDMSIVAAWLRQEGIYAKADWTMDFFGNEAHYPLETGPAIEKAATAVNVIAHGSSTVSFPTGGGVLIQPVQALAEENLLPDRNGELAKTREAVGQTIPEGVWWWD